MDFNKAVTYQPDLPVAHGKAVHGLQGRLHHRGPRHCQLFAGEVPEAYAQVLNDQLESVYILLNMEEDCS